jgi:hypothetical protein
MRLAHYIGNGLLSRVKNVGNRLYEYPIVCDSLISVESLQLKSANVDGPSYVKSSDKKMDTRGAGGKK